MSTASLDINLLMATHQQYVAGLQAGRTDAPWDRNDVYLSRVAVRQYRYLWQIGKGYTLPFSYTAYYHVYCETTMTVRKLNCIDIHNFIRYSPLPTDDTHDEGVLEEDTEPEVAKTKAVEHELVNENQMMLAFRASTRKRKATSYHDVDYMDASAPKTRRSPAARRKTWPPTTATKQSKSPAIKSSKSPLLEKDESPSANSAPVKFTRNKEPKTGPMPDGIRFGLNVKAFLNSISADQRDETQFTNVRMPTMRPPSPLDVHSEEWQKLSRSPPRATLAKVGDTTGLHPAEIQLCQLADMTGPEYKCQKKRLFIGYAQFIEYNLNGAAAWKSQAFCKTQAQQSCNVDVNKVSKMHVAFTQWGWLEGNLSKGIGERLKEAYPKACREQWAKRMQEWEIGALEEAKYSHAVDFVFGQA